MGRNRPERERDVRSEANGCISPFCMLTERKREKEKGKLDRRGHKRDMKLDPRTTKRLTFPDEHLCGTNEEMARTTAKGLRQLHLFLQHKLLFHHNHTDICLLEGA